MVEIPITQPVFTGRRAETVAVVVPVAVEVHRTIVALLDGRPSIAAVREDRFAVPGGDEVHTGGTRYGVTVVRQLVHDTFILILERFQFLDEVDRCFGCVCISCQRFTLRKKVFIIFFILWVKNNGFYL